MNIKRAYLKEWLKRHKFIIFAVFFYAFMTIYYMGPSLTQCTTTVYGFGDNTAGPIWRNSLPEKQGLLGGYTSITNAPLGENIYSPVGYSLILQVALIKSFMAVFGSICGYNLVNILGFMASSLVMYGFIMFLTKRKWLSLFAGYAVAFTPYYQMKVGGHPSYGYQVFFVALIWLFMRLVKYKKKRDAILLGTTFAVTACFDPYFSLYALVIMFTLGLAWLIVFRKSFKANTKKLSVDIKKQLKLFGVTIVVSLILLLPIIFVFISQNSKINETVSAARGNVLAEAKACSNYPQEYFTPFILHPVFERVFGAEHYHNAITSIRGGLTCGIGEDTIGLSLTLVAVFSFMSTVMLWEKVNKRSLKLQSVLTVDKNLILGIGLILGFLGFLIALPPIKYHGFPTPTYEMLSLTSTWRTLTRSYMLVNIALLIIVCVQLAYLLKKFGSRNKYLLIILAIIFVGVFVEYQAFKPFSGNRLSTFNYSKDAPSTYTWLSNQSNIKTIAEYPLEKGGESDATSYYLTMQTIHSKKLFNSSLADSKDQQYKSSLKNIADPQTLPVLRGMGVDAVVVHGVEKSKIEAIPGAKIVFSASQPPFNILSHTPTVKNDNVFILDLSGIKPATEYVNLGKGFARNATIIKSAADWQYEAISGSEFNGIDITNKKYDKLTREMKVCFSAKMSVNDEQTELFVENNGIKQSLGNIVGGQFNNYSFVMDKNAKLYTGNGHNLRVTNIGCR